jgi:tetratricopeptide (TPR) repeat protein
MSEREMEVVRHCTIGDLSRILRVPPWRIRGWAKLGLVTPLDFGPRKLFDFRQASLAKRLCDLLERGQSLAAIRRSLQQLRRWLPEDDLLPLSHVAHVQCDRLLIRLGRRLLDPAGQEHFDFEEDADSTLTTLFPADADLDHLFEQALDCEDAGELHQAADLYRCAIAIDPQEPVLHFNLGNVLYGLGRLDESLASLQQAVEHDRDYAEAWNNLGNVQGELGLYYDAVRSLRRSLALWPGYRLAKSNLSQLLERCLPVVSGIT